MASDSRPASLRDTYNTPSTSWNFQQPPAHGRPSSNHLNTSTPLPVAPSGLSTPPTLTWGQPKSDYFPSSFPGSSSASGTYPYGTASFSANASSYSYHPSPRVALKGLLATAFLQYTMTAIAMPWEVGKVLLQVQWVPKRLEGALAEEYELEFELDMEQEEENDELSESSTDDSYFHDPTSPTRQGRQRAKPLAYPRKTSTDIMAAKARLGISPLVISYGPADGVWGMMRRVRLWRTEGWGSLWKGLLTSVTLSLLTSTVQPSISAFLRPLFPTSHFPLLLPVASHLLTGLLLSPLDALRTLQIIHPRPSPSPLTHLSLLRSSNSSIKPISLTTLYTHPTLLYPTLVDNALRPLLSLLTPRVIEHLTGLRGGVNVWMYPLFEFIGGVVGLGLTIPIETIRRRLQAQIVVHGLPDASSSSSSSPNEETTTTLGECVPSCVHLSPRPYKGMWDCFWRILTEERSGPPPHRRRRRPSMKSPRPSNVAVAVAPAPARRKPKGRVSGGGRRGDVRSAFDDGHRPRMLSEELDLSQHRQQQQQQQQQHETTLQDKAKLEIENAKREIERSGVEGWLESTGFGQLYRGFGMGVGALALVMVLGLVFGEEGEGWAEL